MQHQPCLAHRLLLTGFSHHRVGAPRRRAPALFLSPVPVWGFSLSPGLAVQSPTRSAVPCSSNPDVTLDLGLIWTNGNLPCRARRTATSGSRVLRYWRG